MTQPYRPRDRTREGQTIVELKGKVIPRNEEGDPHFTRLVNTSNEDPPEGTPPSIMMVFTPAEVVAMVNRYIYMTEYSRAYHEKDRRQRQERDRMLKDTARRLFPEVRFVDLTGEQLQQVVEEITKGGGAQ